jgi:hypothetical protein
MNSKKNKKDVEVSGSLMPDLEKAPQSMLHLHRYAGLKREEIAALKNTENRRKQEDKEEYML